jgi:hypothetical protein
MENIVVDKPNLQPEVVPVQEASSGLDSIAQKMAAMKEQTLRNQIKATEQSGTGESKPAGKETSVAPAGVVEDTEYTEPEVADPETEYSEGTDESDAQDTDPVSQEDSTSEDLIDFLEFADTNPNAKFKFMRNGKEVVIDAKKAASILGQGAAISEEARQLKIEKAEFSEYLEKKRADTEGLMLAMEFTIQPQIQKAYDEILKTQGYQATFQQQLATVRDPAQRARIQASITQNEKYIAQQGAVINQLKPRVDEFYQMRSQQVQEILDNGRKNFKDKELKNEYVYNEVREKVAKGWDGAKGQLVPGISNLDLISADEHILGLLRDGLKFRDRPKAKSAGNSIAALTQRRAGSSMPSGRSGDDVSDLREKARGGDKKAADNLLVAQMNALRAQRNRR